MVPDGMMSQNMYLHNIQLCHTKLVAQFQLHLATDITTTRPRNLAWLDFCYLCIKGNPSSSEEVSELDLSCTWPF